MDYQTCCCFARPEPADVLVATNGWTTRPAFDSLGLPLRPGRAATEGGLPDLLLLRLARTCGPAMRRHASGLQNLRLLMLCSAGPCGRPGVTDGRNTRPAAAPLVRPLWPSVAATDGRNTSYCFARLAHAARLGGDGRTTRPAAASLGWPLRPGRAAMDWRSHYQTCCGSACSAPAVWPGVAAKDVRITRPAFASLGLLLRLSQAAMDGWTARPAAAARAVSDIGPLAC
jgi:hypothetical protein